MRPVPPAELRPTEVVFTGQSDNRKRVRWNKICVTKLRKLRSRSRPEDVNTTSVAQHTPG